MSCVGKTTFAKLLPGRYICFDALFPWHQIEALGLSVSDALDHVKECCGSQFVLDGWHLSDKQGKQFPVGTTVYVLYASYDKIIDQYRVPVDYPSQHKSMFNKWYYDLEFKDVRYFENTGDFEERSKNHFDNFLIQHR